MAREAMVTIEEWLGRNEDKNPDSLRRGEIQDDLNAYLRGKSLGTRPGLVHDSDYDSDFAPGGAVQGIYEYRDDFDATRNVVVIANGKFHVIHSGSPTDRTGATTITAGASNVWTFTTFKGQVYAAGGADGDDLLVWDGTTTSNATAHPFTNLAGTTIDAKYIFEKWGRLWVSGMNGTTFADNPMVVRYSQLFSNDLDPSLTLDAGQFSSFGGEFMTGLADFTSNQGEWLMVLSNRRLYAVANSGSPLQPFPTVDVIANGCVHQRAYVNLGLDFGDAVYASTQGIHSLRQSQEHSEAQNRFLSWKIRDTWNDLNKSRIRQITGSYWPTEGIVVYAVSTGSNTSHDALLCLDIKNVDQLTADTARWYVWRLSTAASINANVIAAGRDSNDEPVLFVGTEQGDVAVFSTSTYLDLGSAYEVTWRTHDDSLGSPGRVKGLGDIHARVQTIEISGQSETEPTITPVFNYGERLGPTRSLPVSLTTSVWDSAEWDVDAWSDEFATLRRKVYGTGSGETIGFKFAHSAGNEPFWLANFSYQVRAQGDSPGAADTTN